MFSHFILLEAHLRNNHSDLKVLGTVAIAFFLSVYAFRVRFQIVA